MANVLAPCVSSTSGPLVSRLCASAAHPVSGPMEQGPGVAVAGPLTGVRGSFESNARRRSRRPTYCRGWLVRKQCPASQSPAHLLACVARSKAMPGVVIAGPLTGTGSRQAARLPSVRRHRGGWQAQTGRCAVPRCCWRCTDRVPFLPAWW